MAVDPLIEALPPIPERLSYRIGEVSRLVGVKPHVLRFWEREFPQVRPRKSANGHRLYARADIDRLRRIRVLVHGRGFTLAGARSLFEEGEPAVDAVLARRPSEAAIEVERVEDQQRRLEAEVARLRARLVEAEKQGTAAVAELEFWRVEARKSARKLKKVVGAVESGLGNLGIFEVLVDNQT
jgi:DNA-binding transcriptional MerR regulator